jgi:cell filamentation protein
MNDPYIDPVTGVLRNRLGIADAAALDAFERQIVQQRVEEGAPEGKFDLAHLRAIHRHLFQDLYDWAGAVRTVEIAKGSTQFMPRQFIETGMADVHSRLEKASYLRGLTPEAFAEKASEIIGDVNHAHPFREGNGRTQLEYLRQLAEQAGHLFRPERLNPAQWHAASRAAHLGEYQPMASEIRQALEGERERAEREDDR